ncbi:MAG: hypothetical protein WA823_16880 [Candidatus Acidiferrales bacterium]
MKNVPPPQWLMMAKNAYKTDLGDILPEVVLLTMSAEAFKKFSKSKRAAMAYIDGLHILKQKLISLVFADIWPQKPSGGEWILIIIHTTHSTATVVGWQQPAPAPATAPARVPLSELRKPPSKRRGGPKPDKL